jgi:hypothetical protein
VLFRSSQQMVLELGRYWVSTTTASNGPRGSASLIRKGLLRFGRVGMGYVIYRDTPLEFPAAFFADEGVVVVPAIQD